MMFSIKLLRQPRTGRYAANLRTITIAAESAQLWQASPGPAGVFEDGILWWGGLRQYSLVFHPFS